MFELTTSADTHIVLFQGPGASGKTTVVEAIKLCLYDYDELEELRPLVSQQVVDEAEIGERTSGNVAVTLETGSGNRYRVSRPVYSERKKDGIRNDVGELSLEHVDTESNREQINRPDEVLRGFSHSTAPLVVPDEIRGIGIDKQGDAPSYSDLREAVKASYRITTQNPPDDNAINDEVQQRFWKYLGYAESTLRDDLTFNFSGEDIEPQIEYETEPVEYTPSAGHQILISFALLLAAGDVTATLLPLILDTPFARLDKRGRAAAREMCLAAAPRQVILTAQPQTGHKESDLINPTTVVHELTPLQSGTD